MGSVVLWLSALVPLIFSAGPANITMAAMGARFGIRGALPFFLGINAMLFVTALTVGLGVSRVLLSLAGAFPYLQLLGALYMFYLAYKFFKSAKIVKASAHKTRPRFIDGVFLQVFNVKMLMVNIMMFSQFLDDRSPLVFQVLLLSVGILTLTLSANALWGIGGAWLTRTFASERAWRTQGYVSGIMLAAVGVWMFYESWMS